MTMTKVFARLAAVLLMAITACSSPPSRLQSAFVPDNTLRVAQVVAVANQDEINKHGEVYQALVSNGATDADFKKRYAAAARIYCCGGISKELSSEYTHRLILLVPNEVAVQPGDFVELKVGHSPTNTDAGQPNTVTRLVSKVGEKEACWWEPKNEKLWLRTPYCEWMPAEGWIRQEGLEPGWYKTLTE